MTEKARSSKSSSNDPAYLIVGRVGRAVGLKGEVEVLVLSDDPKRFAPGSVVLRGDTMSALTVSGMRATRDRNVVLFDEIADRTAAESLRGAELVIGAEDARALDDDEYWDHDLLGCAVMTIDGDDVGVVTDVLHQPANEVLLVEGGGKQLLIPLVSSVVKAVEPRRRITIDPPEGLLD